MSSGVELVDVRAGYGAIEVLHGVTMTFPAGSIVALLGRNGSGRSTALSVIGGTVGVRSGAVRFGGHDVIRRPTYERASGMTFIPEKRNVFPAMSVEENLQMFSRGGPIEAAYSTFPQLEPLAHRRAGTLSGGERQMLAVSHAVLRPTPVMLFDEVSSGLAPAMITKLYGVIADMRSPDRSIVVVEQYLREVLRFADFVYVLRRGEVAFAGEPSELVDDELAGVSDQGV